MDDDWDFCDRPISGPTYTQRPTRIPSQREINHFVSIKGDACGLTKSNSTRPKAVSADESRRLIVNGVVRLHESEADNVKKRVQYVGIQGVRGMPSSMQSALNNLLSIESIRGIEISTGTANQLPYFFYGAGAFPNLLRRVIGEPTTNLLTSRMTPAYIKSAKRLAVRGKPYPALVRTDNEDDIVPGMLVFGIKEQQRARIEEFEGKQFELSTGYVTVELADGRIADTKVGVHVWTSDPSALVPREERVWTLEDILQSEWYRNITKNDDSESS